MLYQSACSSHWHYLHHYGQMLTKCKFWSLLRGEVVNSVHRVLSPAVNHLHKVLREKDGESFSVEREKKD